MNTALLNSCMILFIHFLKAMYAGIHVLLKSFPFTLDLFNKCTYVLQISDLLIHGFSLKMLVTRTLPNVIRSTTFLSVQGTLLLTVSCLLRSVIYTTDVYVDSLSVYGG